MRSIDPSFYKSKQWLNCRDIYLSKHPLCEICGEPARYVHHKQHLNSSSVKIPALAYGEANLQALCFDCHEKEHGRKRIKRYSVDAEGNLSPP